MTLVELCAGTASVSLWALGRAAPLTGYMGSKRRWAGLLVDALGVDRPDRVVLVDAGPWGDVWASFRADSSIRAHTAHTLDAWDSMSHTDLWAWLTDLAPPSDSVLRIAQFLWLQARSAGTIPVWWSGERWESPTGSRTEAAHARGGSALATREKGRIPCAAGPIYDASGSRGTRGGEAAQKVRGIQRPSTIARRIRDLEALPWDRIEVLHRDLRTVDPIPGSVVYLGCPRYAALLPRADVLEVARRWSSAGCRVAVSEGTPLPVPGWSSRRLPLAAREWVTANWPIVLPEQLGLWEAA